MFMDAVASLAVFAIIVALAIFSPAPLDAKADPTQKFIAYPAWYFLALYGLLRIAGTLPGNLIPIANLFATVIIPGGLVTLLVLLPFIDRNPSRQLSRRPWVLGLTAVSLVFAIGLSLYSQLAIQKEQAEAGEGGAKAVAAAPAVAGASGASTAGTAAASGSGGAQVAIAGGAAKGMTVYNANCSGCHGAAGAGQAGVFPTLVASEYVTGDTKRLGHILLYGLNGKIKVSGVDYNGQMPAWKGQLSNTDIANVLTYIRSSWGNKAAAYPEAQLAGITK